jgi:hypothetical protein
LYPIRPDERARAQSFFLAAVPARCQVVASKPAQLPVIADDTATDLERKRYGFCADQFRGVIIMTRRWRNVEVDRGVRGAKRHE